MAEIGKIGGFTSLLDDSFIFERLNLIDYPKFVTKTIQLLGANSGLRLVFASDISKSCFIPSTKVVSIPPPPPFPVKRKKEKADELKKRMKPFYDQLAEWRGVLNHEVGHAQFTLWNPHPERKAEKLDTKKKLYPFKYDAFIDLFENGRMERVACDKYPGMIRDLQKLETMLKRIIKKFHKKDGKHFNHLYYAMRMAVNGYNPVIAIPTKLKKDWDICLGFVKEAWGTKSEHETILIAIKTQEYLEKRMKEILEEAKKRREERKKRKEELEKKKEELEKKKEELEKEKKEDGEGDDEENELGEHDDKKDEDGENESDGEGDEENEEMDGEDGDGEEIDDGEMGEEKYDEKGEIEVDGGEDEGGEDGEIGEDNADINNREEEDSEDGEFEFDADSEGTGGGPGASVPNLSDDDPEESKPDAGEGEGDPENEEGQGDEKELEGEREEGEKERIEKEVAELEDEEADIEKELAELDKEDKESPDPDSVDTKGVKTVDPIEEFEEIIALFEKFERYESASNSKVVPMPLDDYVKTINVMPRESTKKTQKILDNIMGVVSGMAQRFIQKVRSSRHVGTRTYKGRISNRNLHKYQTSKNIFKTENMRIKKGASVMIIVDCSASMGGHKIATARKAALVMGEIMYQAKVEFEVVGFTVPFHQQFNFHAFTRKAKLVHYRFASNKDWDHRKHGVVESEKSLRLSDNDDGESLRQFASEIAKSKKEQKMMVVISDGEPCSGVQGGNESKDLHTAIAEIRKEKIEMYAIGLDTKVEKFYGEKNSVNISSNCSTEELVNALAQFIGLIGN